MSFLLPSQLGNIQVFAAVGLALVVIISLLVVARTSGKRAPKLAPLPAYPVPADESALQRRGLETYLGRPSEQRAPLPQLGRELPQLSRRILAARPHGPGGPITGNPAPATGAGQIGTPCAPPGVAAPCGIGVTLVWKPLCASDANCVAPIAKVIGTFESKAVAGSSKVGQELARYRFEMNIAPSQQFKLPDKPGMPAAPPVPAVE